MPPSFEPLPADVRHYAARRGILLESQIGAGVDGTVWSTYRQSAVKGFRCHALFERQRDVYRVRTCSVPSLIDLDDELGVIEIGIVQPPFALDFAAARLSEPHDFPEEVREEWRREKAKQFETDWPEVRLVIAAFERYGIFLGDVHPGNICLRNESM